MAAKPYEVDVGGVTYDVDAPDEATAWRWANIEHSKAQKQIPDSIPQNPRKQQSFFRGDPSKSVLGNIVQAGADIGSLALEVPATLLSGVASGVIAPLTALATQATGGDMYQMTAAANEALERFTYRPRNEMGQQAVSAIGEALSPLIGVPIPTLNALGRAAPPAINALTARAKTAAPQIVNMLQPTESPQMVGMGAAATELPIQRQTMAASARIPLKLSKGQVTRNLEQQQFEHETAKTYPEKEGKPLLLQQQKLNEDFLKNFDASAEAMGGEIYGETQLVPIGKVVDAQLVKKFNEAKKEVGRLYTLAENAGETQELVPYANLIEYIEKQPPTTRRSLAPILNATREQLKLNDPTNTGLISIRNFETIYKDINRNGGDTNSNIHHSGEMKKLINENLTGVGGDLFKAARAENTKFMNEFENHAIISKLLRNKPGTKDRAVAFEDIYKHMVHGGSADDLKLGRDILLKAGEEGSFAWNQIRAQAANELKERAMANISKDAAGNPIPNAKALRNSVKQLDRDGKLDLLFGKEEAQRVRDLVQLGGDIYSPVPGTVSPGTASVYIRFLDAIAKNAIVSRTPIVRSVASGAAEMASKKAREKRVSEAVNFNALIP
jgi:hypothetical protein